MTDHYRVKCVDGRDPYVTRDIFRLHEATFGVTAPLIAPWVEHCWLAYQDGSAVPVGFTVLTVDEKTPETGYLYRSGVTKAHRGNGLQLRFIRARERKARLLGLKRLVSDTSDNPESARNLQRAGYSTFDPTEPWGWKHTLYWEKHL